MTRDEYKNLKVGDKLIFNYVSLTEGFQKKEAFVVKTYKNWQVMIRLKDRKVDFIVGYSRLELMNK